MMKLKELIAGFIWYYCPFVRLTYIAEVAQLEADNAALKERINALEAVGIESMDKYVDAAEKNDALQKKVNVLVKEGLEKIKRFNNLQWEEIGPLKADNAALHRQVEGLRKYVQHKKESCELFPKNWGGNISTDWHPTCTCGLDALEASE